MSSSLRFQQSLRAGQLGTVRMGKSFDALITPGAKVLGTQTTGAGRTTRYDLNGDGQADLLEVDTLDSAGKVTRRELSTTVETSRGQATYTIDDWNNDGKIDGLRRVIGTHDDYLGDTNHDGKTDQQVKGLRHASGITRSHSLLDTDGDGRPDATEDTRRGYKHEQMAQPIAVGSFGSVLGKSVNGLLAGARVLERTTEPNGQVVRYDLDGDGQADLYEEDFASSFGTRRSFHFATGGAFEDSNGDGTVDLASQVRADGSLERQQDVNGDGKVDLDSVQKGAVTVKTSDTDGDGYVDWVTTRTQLA